MLSKSIWFVACLLVAHGAMGETGQLEIQAPGPVPLQARRKTGLPI